jgi:hypothetical protein
MLPLRLRSRHLVHYLQTARGGKRSMWANMDSKMKEGKENGDESENKE